ncbi:hypothetical protein AB0K20_30120 [Micromonospora matsumotoense]|uniref:metallophosphoesterase family protein n=1 Tax=Micromonospora matsumotoense TaxID=121616 RepID=UPI003442EA34
MAGNHDVVSTVGIRDLDPTAALLDGTWVDRGGIRFAGVSGIIGGPRRQGRHHASRQLASIDAVLAGDPDVLVLHEGPPGGTGQAGNPAIGARLHGHTPALTVCGHVHWDEALARLGDGHILNVDGRVVILTP